MVCVCGGLRLCYDCLGVMSGGESRRAVDTARLHLNYLQRAGVGIGVVGIL